MLQPRLGRHIIIALEKLGLTRLKTTAAHVTFIRTFPHVIHVMPDVVIPVLLQEEYLRQLNITEAAFLAALPPLC